MHVFSEQEAQRFLGPRIWDHAIKLKPVENVKGLQNPEGMVQG